VKEGGDLNSGDGDFEVETGLRGNFGQHLAETRLGQPAGDEQQVLSVNVPHSRIQE
jgi:hypothetical protein